MSYAQAEAAADIKLEGGKLERFKLKTSVNKMRGEFFYFLFFYRPPDRIGFLVSEHKIEELLELIEKAEDQMEKIDSTEIKEIRVSIGSFRALGNEIGIFIAKKQGVETSLTFQISDRHRVNFIALFDRSKKDIRELKNHLTFLKIRMEELRVISIEPQGGR